MSKLDPLKNLSPLFPWFGGKRRVASVIWQALGSQVDLYVEPFAGAAAVFLARPFMRRSGYEVINDADGFVVNAYRSVKADPATVLRYVEDLRSELEMLSRHRWLRGLREDLWSRLMGDPEFFDAKVAGMWIFGQCNAIGAAWNAYGDSKRILPTTHNVGDSGVVTNGPDMMRPFATNRMGLACDPEGLLDAYVQRLEKTIILCGDFERAVSESYLKLAENAGVFLDPPYEGFDYYGAESGNESPSDRARKWAIENGENPKLRIVLAGFEGEHEMPAGWRKFAWATPGGFANQKAGKANENAERERLWFSPHCNRVEGAK